MHMNPILLLQTLFFLIVGLSNVLAALIINGVFFKHLRRTLTPTLTYPAGLQRTGSLYEMP